MGKSLIDHSKIHYNIPGDENTAPNLDQLNTGSLQRIAEATELMASNFIKLQNDLNDIAVSRDYYKRCFENLRKRNIALKGVITKLKKNIGK